MSGDQIKNKKYLFLKRYLPIVPDPFFRIHILYKHFSRIIKATLSQFMHFFNPSNISVVNTERACLPIFTTYHISHRHSLTTQVSIIPYPACLPTLTLLYPTHDKYLGYIYPAYPTPLHLATPYFTYAHLSLHLHRKNEITIRNDPGWNNIGRNETGLRWLSADHNLWAWSVFGFTIYINFYKTSHRMVVLLLAGGVRTKKDKQPINFHLNVAVVYILLVRKYTDAIKLTTAHCFSH